ncbi:MAG: hypothetical protein JXK93_13650 [Sphaerochaetaceae bacterium]|nr:hypothetical protein [Sphaerochaetaceae bacterium]
MNDVISSDILFRDTHSVQLRRLDHILMNRYSQLITFNKLNQRFAGERNIISLLPIRRERQAAVS